MPATAKRLDFTNRAASNVVLISDQQEVLGVCARQMAAANFQITAIGFSGDTIEILRRTRPPLTVVDLSLPGTGGLELLEAVREEKLQTAIIAVSRDGSLKRAVQAMKLGAFDYFPEPFDDERLILAMNRAVGQAATIGTLSRKSARTAIDELQNVIGLPQDLRNLYRAIEDAGASSQHVLIAGESGLGLEVCAKAVHNCSARRHQPFVTVNCHAIPQSQLDSELFGHVPEAFSGAVGNWAGRVTQAHGGTLFLDGIDALPSAVISKILQLAEFGTFQRLGQVELKDADIRIIATANRDLAQASADGAAPATDFDKLDTIKIEMPVLKRRNNDILQIARLFFMAPPTDESETSPEFVPDAASEGNLTTPMGDARGLQEALQDALTTDSDRMPSTPGPETAAGQPANEEPSQARKTSPVPQRRIS